MRFAWVLGACAWLGCTHASTSDCAVAAGFAAAAGALQVAEAAHNGQRVSSCGTRTCGGCCDLTDHCVDGTADDACGTSGSICRNCVVSGHQTCGDGTCSPSSMGASQASSTSPFGSGSAPSAQASTPPCGQVVVFCFPTTHSVCVTDASGCSLCSCTPDTGVDSTTTR